MSGGGPLDHTLGSGDSIPALFAGRYRVLRPLGRGASKEVYLAHDERLDRKVALALLTRGTGAARVRREMQVTGRLGEHPHVVTVHDAGEHDGLAYLVLRAVEGGSLAARAAAAPGQRLPVEEVVRIGREVADALAHAHDHGIVHRDVKPDNVWLDGAARAVLGDFGVALDSGDAARLTADRAVIGTLAYLSPEQARGDPATPASDLYGLGTTLYELACGRPPFTGETAEALIAQHLHAAPAAPSAHEPAAAPLDGLLLRLLAKDPAQRAASAERVRDELAALADGGTPAPADRGLVGRGPAMSALRAACDEVIAGGLRVVGLAGEAGIGKTRCAEELAAHARSRGCLVAWGACEEDEGALAYWPWRRVLRELGDATGELLSAPAAGAEADADEARFALWEGVARCLAESAAQRPLAIVLEDVHWADPSSLGLLAHLARALRGVRLLVLLTHRPADDPLQEALGRLAGFSGLELDGLDADEVAELAEAVGGRAVPPAEALSLRERTRGNPLYVSELVRALAVDGPAVPSGLRTIIARRAAMLPQHTRDTLELAAVAGTEFSLPVVGRVAALGRAELLAALEPALRDGLLTHAGGARCRFSHAVTRDVVYEGQPLAPRAERHARLAEVLEVRLEREPDQPVAEIAHHAVMAARGGLDAAPALRWSREAAHEARALLAYTEAVFHLDRALEALELGELGTAGDRLSLLLQAAETNAEAAALGAAQQRFEQAAALARRLSDAGAFAEAALGYAEFQHYGVVDEAALGLLEEARALLPEGVSVLHAQVLGRLAVRLDPTTEQPRRESLLDEAIAMARAVGDSAALARLLALSPLVNWRPQSSERRHADAAEVLALAASGADREAALWAHIVLHTERFADGDIAGADRELAAYDRLAGELRRRYYRCSRGRPVTDARAGPQAASARRRRARVLNRARPDPRRCARDHRSAATAVTPAPTSPAGPRAARAPHGAGAPPANPRAG